MRVLFYTTSSNDVNKLLDSLRCQREHDVHVFAYDQKWLAHVAELHGKAGDRGNPAAAQMGQMAIQELNQGVYKIPAGVDVTCDVEMIREIERVRPEVAIYISAWEGTFVPMNETLAAINRKVPLIHMCCDAGDPPWWPQMVTFDRDKCFALTWNIDGAQDWPGGAAWDVSAAHTAWGAKPAAAYTGPAPRRFYPNPIPAGWKINGLTTLTPVDPSYFDGPQIAFRDRPFRIGYAGNFGGWMRKAVIEFMQTKFAGVFAPYQRDDHPNSYANYCEFLKYCQCVINVPFSGSNAAKQVKGRIVEAGWAGCAVLEWKGAPTKEWFPDHIEYYAGLGDLEIAVDSILEGSEEVEEMARRHQELVRSQHAPAVIWGQVLKAVR